MICYFWLLRWHVSNLIKWWGREKDCGILHAPEVAGNVPWPNWRKVSVWPKTSLYSGQQKTRGLVTLLEHAFMFMIYIYIYMYVCIYIYICVYIYTYDYICMFDFTASKVIPCNILQNASWRSGCDTLLTLSAAWIRSCVAAWQLPESACVT